MPRSSWAVSSLHAFIFNTGFCGRICSPPCPSSFVLPNEFAVLYQTGSEIVYQRFTFWPTRLPGLSRTRAIFLLGLLGWCLSHLCSFASSLSDCLRMERLWFCWLCCFGSAVKHLLIIGAKKLQSTGKKSSGKSWFSFSPLPTKCFCELMLEMKMWVEGKKTLWSLVFSGLP